MVTGALPIIPLDLAETTWLVELLEGPLTTEELIGYCACALAKHYQHMRNMREHVGKDKLQWALKFAEEHKHSIKDYNFKPLDLVLVKNMITESSFSAKMLPWFHSPMVVIAKTKGGNYIVAELDGLKLLESLEQWVDITPTKLKELREELQKPTEVIGKDITFESIWLHEPTDSGQELTTNDTNILKDG
ncbi:hypothetical protein C0993_010290 [Termitomyces sp. T159_Od127]|nr:hypothetical protein C0993_010290 [Termitomyces sp. T159_Od127]